MGHQTVQEAMTSNPTAITPDTTVQEAAQLMKSEDVGALPIVEDGRLTCVVTDRDLAIRGIAEGLGTDTAVRDLASKDVVTIDPAAEPRRGRTADGGAPGAAPARPSRRTAAWSGCSRRPTSPQPATTRSRAKSSQKISQ